MSEKPQTRPKIPDGKADRVTTRQKKANKEGFVGYETVWEPFHKESEYKTPQTP